MVRRFGRIDRITQSAIVNAGELVGVEVNLYLLSSGHDALQADRTALLGKIHA
jgi:hypothetical protein